MIRRVLAGKFLATTFAAAALTAVGFALPAQAAVVPDALGFIDTQTCDDAGGVPYTVSVDWNYKYVDANGVLRVSVNPLVIRRDDADAGPAADAGVDVRYRVYSNTSKIQDVIFDGLDLDFGVDDQASFNPRNPRSNAGLTKVTVIVGTDGDSLGNCPKLTFVQPAGIGTRGAV